MSSAGPETKPEGEMPTLGPMKGKEGRGNSAKQNLKAQDIQRKGKKRCDKGHHCPCQNIYIASQVQDRLKKNRPFLL